MKSNKDKDDEHTNQLWQRIDAVVLLILENDKYLQHKRAGELTELIAGKFKVSPRTAQRYVKDARREVRKIGKAKKEKAFEKAIRDRELLFSKAKGIKDEYGNVLALPDLKSALEILKDRDKLYGLYVEESKQQIDVSFKDINLSSLTDDQLIKLKQYLKSNVPLRDALLHIGVIIK